jgi:hypothetical protein
MKDTLLPFCLTSRLTVVSTDSGDLWILLRSRTIRVEEVVVAVYEQARKRTLTRLESRCNWLKVSVVLLAKVGRFNIRAGCGARLEPRAVSILIRVANPKTPGRKDG